MLASKTRVTNLDIVTAYNEIRTGGKPRAMLNPPVVLFESALPRRPCCGCQCCCGRELGSRQPSYWRRWCSKECLVTDGGVSITDSVRAQRIGSIGRVLAAGAIAVKRAKTGAVFSSPAVLSWSAPAPMAVFRVASFL